jgi:hypothetical protein
MAKANAETSIQRDILDFINRMPGFNAWRQGNHAVPIFRKQFLQGRWAQILVAYRKNVYTRLGLADILFIKKNYKIDPDLNRKIPVEGTVGFIEVKTPTGKQSPEQVEFQAICSEFCIYCFVCRSIPDLEAQFKLRGWLK